MARARARDLVKEAAWRRRVAQHAESGQSVRSWCRRHGVKEAAFHWWRRELVRRDAEQACRSRRDAVVQSGSFRHGAEAAATSFMPVRVTADSVPDVAGEIEIGLPGGQRIRITGRVDREMLTEVLDVLTSMSAVEAERRAC